VLRHRWTPVAAVALALLVMNILGRLVVLLTGMDADRQMVLASLYSMVAMALVAGYAGFHWTRRYDVTRVVGEVGGAILLGSLATVLVGPLVVGLNPFTGGAGIFLRQLGLCFVICVIGAVIGLLVVMALGQDRKSRAWKYQVERARARPPRVAKR
jgi:hypothetical protein